MLLKYEKIVSPRLRLVFSVCCCFLSISRYVTNWCVRARMFSSPPSSCRCFLFFFASCFILVFFSISLSPFCLAHSVYFGLVLRRLSFGTHSDWNIPILLRQLESCQFAKLSMSVLFHCSGRAKNVSVWHIVLRGHWHKMRLCVWNIRSSRL